jgi:hypothetical protein
LIETDLYVWKIYSDDDSALSNPRDKRFKVEWPRVGGETSFKKSTLYIGVQKPDFAVLAYLRLFLILRVQND